MVLITYYKIKSLESSSSHLAFTHKHIIKATVTQTSKGYADILPFHSTLRQWNRHDGNVKNKSKTVPLIWLRLDELEFQVFVPGVFVVVTIASAMGPGYRKRRHIVYGLHRFHGGNFHFAATYHFGETSLTNSVKSTSSVYLRFVAGYITYV